MSTNKLINGSLSANTLNLRTIGETTSVTNLGIDSLGNIVSGLTGSLIDIRVTGGTYSSGTTTFTNNTGGTFNVNGYYTGTTNLANILFVSSYGNDSTGVKGYVDKPFLTLKGARDAAISGDTIHVFPQTFIFDNRNSNSNFWNGKQADINLWKNGVTYFFEPNCKIKFYNQTVSGQDLYLISPTTTTGETCTILGYLEYEQYSTGADSSNGANRFYLDENSNPHTFYAQLKSLYSEHCEFIKIHRLTTVGTSETKVTIITDSEIRTYVAGQSSSGSAVFIGGISLGATDDPFLTLMLYSKYRNVNNSKPFYFFGNLNGSTLNINGEVCVFRANGNLLARGRYTVDYNINKTYITRSEPGNLWYGSFASTTQFNNGILNVKGDIIDNQYNSETNGVFHIGGTSYNNTFNFDGNITTKTNSGTGRFIAMTDGVVTGNTINIKGDINYIGSGVTTQNTFRTNGGSGNTINYSGKIIGNFAGAIASCYSGTININNSNIKSIIDGSSSSIGLNGSTSLGTIRINNSYIELKNSTNAISNGSYVNQYINNSIIVNSAGSGLSNTTAFGLLETLNSTIVTSGTSINYTSTAPITSSNSTTNNNYNINTLYGDISTISGLNTNKYINGSLSANTLNLKYISGATSITNLGIDSDGNVVSGSTSINITYAALSTLLSTSAMTKDATYYITDKQIWIKALENNILESTALRKLTIIKDSAYHGTGTLGVWNDTLTPSIGNKVIWGGKLWNNITGSVGSNFDDETMDATDWTLITSDSLYYDKIFDVEYDFSNDVINLQSDDRGNIVKVYNALNSYIDVTDWGNTLIKLNSTYGIYNNHGDIEIYENENCFKIFNNKAGTIYRNLNVNNIQSNSGNIGGNSSNRLFDIVLNTGSVFGNIMKGNITANSGTIQYNSNNGNIGGNSSNISYNSNNGTIGGNACSISNNTNNGTISNNTIAVLSIYRNSNIGEISYNSNIGEIYNNINNGHINTNSNVGEISYNSNNGNIESNTQTSGTCNITNNNNNGNISGARTTDVAGTIVNL